MGRQIRSWYTTFGTQCSVRGWKPHTALGGMSMRMASLGCGGPGVGLSVAAAAAPACDPATGANTALVFTNHKDTITHNHIAHNWRARYTAYAVVCGHRRLKTTPTKPIGTGPMPPCFQDGRLPLPHQHTNAAAARAVPLRHICLLHLAQSVHTHIFYNRGAWVRRPSTLETHTDSSMHTCCARLVEEAHSSRYTHTQESTSSCKSTGQTY